MSDWPEDERHPYAVAEAREGAEARGFRFSIADWRSVFLAITDTMAHTKGAPPHVTAAYIGETRNGERWTIYWRSTSFDVIYDPSKPIILSVTDTRRGSSGPVVVPIPRGPKPLQADTFVIPTLMEAE